MTAQGIQHAIGTEKYPAPQATLMATLIKGILSFNLDWQFVFVGVFIAVTLMNYAALNPCHLPVGDLSYLSQQRFQFLLAVL